MSGPVEDIRAMLALFARSPWRDLHVRTGGWEMFFARPGGAANPMAAQAEEAASGSTVDAPHLGLFFTTVQPGADIVAGSVIGQIEVLGEREDIVADRPGQIAVVLVEDGGLVEFATPLVRLAA